MDLIFHEKQEGHLCAQHALNAILQGAYFTAVDLAELARNLDDQERATMAEGGINSPEYMRFLEQPSSNMDDSGFFSVQVLQIALRVWGLEIVPFASMDANAQIAKQNPQNESAFICNYREHWFSIRKIGNQWFNLNSLLTSPELISDTYLSLFLAQLAQEGYSIFVILGTIPETEADHMLRLCPAIQRSKPKLLSEVADQMSKAGSGSRLDSEESDLQKALRMSLETEPVVVNHDDLRGRRLAYFDANRPPADNSSKPDAVN